MDHPSHGRSKDFLSPQASTRTLGSVTSHRSQRSASSRRRGLLSTIPSRSNISVLSPSLSHPIDPATHLQSLSSTHVLSHNPYPHQNRHLQPYVAVDTASDPFNFVRGPDRTGCPKCGVDPAFLFPKHPWDYRRPWWEHLKREYDIVKPYLEWQRREKYLTKQRRRREGKLKRQRFVPRALRKNWRVELKRLSSRLAGWKTWEPGSKFRLSRQDKQQQQPQQPQQPSEQTFELRITSDEELSPGQDDRNVQGHEARQELVREPEARPKGKPVDTSNARNSIGGLVGKHENKGPGYVISPQSAEP
jgi:hypothetical protein